MRKNLTVQVMLFFSISILSAQSVMTLTNHADLSPFDQNSISKTNPQLQTIWDILYDYDLLALTGTNGNAGVCFFNNEFWVSRWSNDTIKRLDASGSFIDKFTIPGVTGGTGSGVRSFTTDGTYIYAGVNTNSIKKINPSTKTLAGTITAPIPSVRSLTYDPTADGGAGGFWISTFTTTITQISMTGTTLNSIPASSHGLTGMYGTAYDNYSSGGPYLWVFDQGYSGNYSDIIQINIATGEQTGIFHDVMSDIGVNNGLVNTPGDPTKSSLAGGLSLRFQSPIVSLIGVIQGTPTNRLFAYEIDVNAAVHENQSPDGFVNVYPNPANNMVNIHLDKQNNDEIRLQIFDVIGKTVFDKKTRGLNNYINLSEFDAGLYLIKATYNGKVFTSKLVKE